MKKVILLGLLVLITGCSKSYENREGDFILPPELSDCSIYRLSNGSGTRIYVVSCDNRKTTSTTLIGKHQKYGVVVE